MAGPQEDLWDNRDRGWGHSLRRRAIQLVHGLRPPRALVQNGCAPQHQQQQPCLRQGGDLRTPAAVDAGVSAAAHVCRDSPCTWGTGHARAGSRAQVGIPQPRLLRVWSKK
eukprot:CAMPEP_0177456936 /NCGR_PEP_ID=MMETSP0369-20130122/12709_1 /TAXON_ID=447022 ORGANISM="Scrippsiella hangoei-like, Strain SHHI-4" /NCGR_SAMPLE_ID=MMETSP0369 /ASSEMBLY_ACC=CAM_ASM_000364 /LENGTH=110 /DNA_ID=CAMNT_0018929913 /DNA_START=252 /DNA_END=581 /DNA_ORIENTATION=+